MDQDAFRAYIDQSQSLIKSAPQMDEQNTKRKLIEPLLELLGWEMLSSNVELEYSIQIGTGTKKVDYALILDNTPVVFVEAKGLDSSLTDSDRQQLRSYLRQTGVDWGLLTNGQSFEIYKRQTDSNRPNEITLGSFELDNLMENASLIQTLSRDLIESGEADVRARTFEERRRSAEALKENKAEIADDITDIVNRFVAEAFSQSVKEGAKQFVDSLAYTLEHDEGDVTVKESGPQTSRHRGSDDWEPSPEANAISGTISREKIEADPDDLVAVFPSKESGVEFLKENNAWGFVRIGQQPDFVAIYVSEGIQEIRYVAKVKDIVQANNAELARPKEFYAESGSESEQAGFEEGKQVIVFEAGSLYELEDPIPFGSKYPMSLRYAKWGDMREAETTNDFL